jgi:cytochrome c oxidase subunit 2
LHSVSPNAHEIASLFDILVAIAIVVFVLVEGALVYSLIRFRARKGAVAAQIRGNTSLEIGWTVAAAVILVALAAITFIKLGSIRDPAASGPGGLASDKVLYAALDQPPPPGGRRLSIDVNGQQFVWRYVYPNGAYSYETMIVPVDTTVTLNIRSQDVVHSWWIPKLGGKADAVPGNTNHTWFKVSRPGVYHGQCAALCGRLHANMIAHVKVVPVAQYQAWVARQKRLITDANGLAAAERARFSPIK